MSAQQPKRYNRNRRTETEDGGARMGPGVIGAPSEKPKDFKRTAKRLIHYLRPHLAKIILMTILSILVTIIGVVAPDFLRRVINHLQETITGTAPIDSAGTIRTFVFLLMSLYVIRFLFDLISSLLGNHVSNIVGRTMREQLRDKMERLPIRF
ncbi:MAG: ABC transporter transmembrane domain-containing protein, partial [bacterium]